METFKIARGTPGLLLVEEEGFDMRTEDWETRKDLEYNRNDVIVDPNISNSYPKKSPAADLAKRGYFIFAKPTQAVKKYMLAVQYTNVTVS